MKFLLTTYPWGHQVNEREWMPGRYNFMSRNSAVSDKSLRTIQEFATKSGIDFLDFFPIFRSYNGNKPLYFNYDNHWTTEGHKIMSSGFNNYLDENYWRKVCK